MHDESSCFFCNAICLNCSTKGYHNRFVCWWRSWKLYRTTGKTAWERYLERGR